MRINTYRELTPDDYYLDFKDYSESFRNEIAFGKKLNVFFDFMQQLLKEKDEVKKWVDSGWAGCSSDEVKDVLRNGCKEFLEIIEEKSNNNNKINNYILPTISAEKTEAFIKNGNEHRLFKTNNDK